MIVVSYAIYIWLIAIILSFITMFFGMIFNSEKLVHKGYDIFKGCAAVAACCAFVFVVGLVLYGIFCIANDISHM